MGNKRELIIRGAAILALLLIIVFCYLFREKTEDKGDSGFLEQTVWEGGDIFMGSTESGRAYVVFRENTFEISTDEVMVYEGTYHVDEDEKEISFIFSLRPEGSQVRRREQAEYEFFDDRLEISFREEKWKLDMKVNLKKEKAINNRCWKCVEGDYKDYCLYTEGDYVYVIDSDNMCLIRYFYAEYKEFMKLRETMANDKDEQHVLEYGVEDKKLILSDKDRKSVFETMGAEEEKRVGEIIEEAKKNCDQLYEMINTSLWTGRINDKDYQICFLPDGSSIHYYIYCLQDETILSEGRAECVIEGGIMLTNVQYYQNMHRAYEDIRLEVSGDVLMVDFDKVTDTMDKDIFREDYDQVSYKETSREQIFLQALFEKQNMEEGFPQAFSEWYSKEEGWHYYIDADYVNYEKAEMIKRMEEGEEYKPYNYHLWIEGQDMKVSAESLEGFSAFDGALYGEGYIVDMDQSKMKVCFYSSGPNASTQKKLRTKGVMGTIYYDAGSGGAVTLEIGEEKIEYVLQQ